MDILNNRASGVLMHISSLPGSTGIGTLGQNAYKFVDFLKKSGQSYWQILPICPTSFGDSPYQSFSTFAGNPYFIDFEILEKDGYLTKNDYSNIKWCDKDTSIDFGRLYTERNKVFSIIQNNFNLNPPADFELFCTKNKSWLDDYALFMAIKDEHHGKAFDSWENDIKCRTPQAFSEWTTKCKNKINYYKILQYLFFHQWNLLKSYANQNGIKIIGDIPIYVSADSSDVWTNPELFLLDKNNSPIEVAGCPPDGFSESGQLWGNPVYNWENHKKTNYSWWIKRLSESLKTYDILRIDHFRGFDSFYSIKYPAKDAKIGKWNKGPGIDLFNTLKKQFNNVPIIAEDLGFLTDSVRNLLKETGFPGMKVLQFAFDSRETSDYLPYRYTRNCVVYTGTHDNDTILGWTKTANQNDVQNALSFFRINNKNDLREEMMIGALSSVANTCILTMQDLIGLDSDCRMNIPSTVGQNWKWRVTEDQINDDISAFLLKYTKLYGR